MGRIAGVTAKETRQRLLRTAAKVFARRGYEGASVAEIASEAGLSSGAIYAHYAGKAELFVATLREHGAREFERLLGGGALDVTAVLVARGEALDRRSRAERTLLVEAIVAAKRHPEVAKVLRSSLADREETLAALLGASQERGEVDAGLSAEAIVRFTLMVALGSLLVGALDLPPVDHDEWKALIAALVDAVRTTTAGGGREA